MGSTNDTEVKNKKPPKLNEVSLKEIQQYYQENLMNRNFKFLLGNDKEINIRFFKENLIHLLGIHKLAPRERKKHFVGENGYEQIQNQLITIEELKKLDEHIPKDQRQLNKIEYRITCFNLIGTLMNQCKMVKFFPERTKGNCNLTSEFVLYDEQLGLKLHLGVKRQGDGQAIYIPETFIVLTARDRNKNYYTDRQQYVNIVSREIERID